MHALTLLRRLFASCILACAVPAQVSYFAVGLDGASEVPPNPTTGGGYGIVRLDEPANNVRVFVSYYGLTGAPMSAHIHRAAAGANGPVVIGLAAGPSNTFTGTGVMAPADVTLLKNAGMYLNVHTPAFPGGEIRGQVVRSRSTPFTAMLTGAQEVPPTPSTAIGFATAFLHEPDNRLIYFVDSFGLANVVAAHLHDGAAGTNGAVLFPLNGSSGQYCGVSGRLSTATLARLAAGNTYFNIHTSAFPGGEIRGQVAMDAGTHFIADLDGLQEVPPVPTPALGSASLIIDGASGAGFMEVSYAGLLGANTAAHIHDGAVGVNGPPLVTLAPNGPGRYSASFTPSTTFLTQVRAGNLYVNVHSSAFPGGEIRGQLRRAVLPATFGPTCPGSNGNRPEIGARGFPGLGAAVGNYALGGLPGTPTFLMFGLNRDNAGASPLPLPFPAAGLNAPCFFLLDPIATLLTFADLNGCALQMWNVPFNPGLRGINVFTQFVLFDAAANPAGFVSTNAQTLTVQ